MVSVSVLFWNVKGSFSIFGVFIPLRLVGYETIVASKNFPSVSHQCICQTVFPVIALFLLSLTVREQQEPRHSLMSKSGHTHHAQNMLRDTADSKFLLLPTEVFTIFYYHVVCCNIEIGLEFGPTPCRFFSLCHSIFL